MNFSIHGAFNNFVMQTTKVMTKVKEIVVNSPKYGQKIILIDSEDYELVSKYGWHLRKDTHTFYAHTNINLKYGRSVLLLHRLILGAKKGEMIDHKDGNGLNCTRSNIRFCTPHENALNRNIKSNSLGFRNIIKRNNKFMVRISNGKKRFSVGTFDSLQQAIDKYNLEAKKYYGEFAKLL